MRYQGDRTGVQCKDCKEKVKIVRCPKCNGVGGGLTTHCSRCKSSGYVCENAKDQWHQYQ